MLANYGCEVGPLIDVHLKLHLSPCDISGHLNPVLFVVPVRVHALFRDTNSMDRR